MAFDELQKLTFYSMMALETLIYRHTHVSNAACEWLDLEVALLVEGVEYSDSVVILGDIACTEGQTRT